MYTEKQLTEQVLALGIKSTDTLAIHTALKAVGKISCEGKRPAVALIDALRAAVSDGLLIVPAFTFLNIREDGPFFDVRRTVPCIGGVPAAAVEMANAAQDQGKAEPLRSLHPSHSVVAFGKNAPAYVADDAKATTPFPTFGSYGKMMTMGGKLLFIGAPLSTNSFIHALDEYLEPTGVHSPSTVTVTDYDGNTVERTAARCQGSSSQYPLYLPYLEKAGAVTHGKIGDADATLIDALLCTRVVSAHRTEVRAMKA